MKTNLEKWECWFHEHRADEIAVLVLESIRILLRQGSMTAENIHHIPVKNPNVRGAVMRQLRRMGIAEKGDIVYGSTKSSKGHVMFTWKMSDSVMASKLLNRCASVVVRVDPVEDEQTVML